MYYIYAIYICTIYMVNTIYIYIYKYIYIYIYVSFCSVLYYVIYYFRRSVFN